MKAQLKRIGKVFLLTIAALFLIILGYVLITFPTVMAGMVAKTMCSCVYVTGRTPESVRQKELQVFPGLSSAGVIMNDVDSSVVAKILWKTSKAIYRKGLGCTLLAQRSEEEVRNQKISIATAPSYNQDSILWPTGNIKKAEAIPGVDYDSINNAVENAFYEIDSTKPAYTHAVVVVYDGQIVGEKYAEGFNINTKLMGWSMTKSITNAFIGILVKEGNINIEDRAPVKEWQQDERKQITINNLLQASSGLDWSESYFIPTSHFHNMFIKSDDKGGYAASQKLKHKPSEFFQYSSGTTNILSRIIRQKVGDADYYRFPYEKLFYKIGMLGAIIEPDASGTFVGSSYSYATARDWARFGLLFLNDGVWNGERILPEGWVKYSTTPAPTAPLQKYGAQWWLNAGEKNNTTLSEFPGLPHDSFLAEGFEKQFVVIIPSRKLVVVRLGVTHNKNFSIEKFVSEVIKGLPE